MKEIGNRRSAFADWKFWIGISVSAVFLWLSLRNADFREVAQAFRTANYWWVIPSVAANLMGLVVRSFRWRFLLKPIRLIRMRDLFSSTMIGFMGNNLFPARLGELLRAYVLGIKTGVSKTASFATIILERMFDGMTVLSMLAVVVVFFDLPFSPMVRKASMASAALYLALLFLMIAMKVRTTRVMRMFETLFSPFPSKIRIRIMRGLHSFVDGLDMLRDAKSIVISLALSALLWMCPAFAIYFILLATGIHLPVYAAFFLLVILCIGVAVPSAPGFLGTIQYVSVIGLALFGVSKSLALSFSVLYHVSQWAPVTAIGLVFFFTQGFSFSRIGEGGENKE